MLALHVYVLPTVAEPMSAEDLRANARALATLLRAGVVKVWAEDGEDKHELSSEDVESFAKSTADLGEPIALPVAAVPEATKALFLKAEVVSADWDDKPAAE